MKLWYTQHYGQHAAAAAAAAAAAHMAGANAADAANAAAAAAHTAGANASAGQGSMQPPPAPGGWGCGLGSVLAGYTGFGVAAPTSQHGGGNKVAHPTTGVAIASSTVEEVEQIIGGHLGGQPLHRTQHQHQHPHQRHYGAPAPQYHGAWAGGGAGGGDGMEYPAAYYGGAHGYQRDGRAWLTLTLLAMSSFAL